MIVTNVPDPEIGNNIISTSKYNLISFPIFNLLEQFTKPSNSNAILIHSLLSADWDPADDSSYFCVRGQAHHVLPLGHCCVGFHGEGFL